MKSTPERRLGHLLKQGNLGNLTAEARQREALVTEIRRKLPAAEAAELLAAHREPDGELILTMSSPAWAARVRYRAKDIGESKLRVRVAAAP